METAYLCTTFLLVFLVNGSYGYMEIDNDLNDFEVGHAKKYKCPSLFGAYPDPDDCGYFYVCVGGFGRRTACPPFNGFDILRRRCVSILIAICGNKRDDKTTKSPKPVTTNPEEKFKCPGLTGSYPHPIDCSKYYSCLFFIPSTKTCPKGQLFDGVKKECRDSDQVHCGNRIRPEGYETTVEVTTETETTTRTTTEEQGTTTEEQETTSEEKETTTEEQETTTEELETTTEEQETTITTEPTESTLPDVMSTKATGPPETDCDDDDLDCIIEDTGEEPEWFECPEDVGSYPHPSSRKLFIFCLNWRPSVKKCGQDLVFNDDYGTCVQPDSEEED